MNVSESQLQEVKDQLAECKQTVLEGEELSADSRVEVDVDGGEISLRPEGGTKVSVWFFDDKGAHGFDSVTSEVGRYLRNELGFPNRGAYKPYSSVISPDKERIRLNFEYFLENTISNSR